MSSYHPCTMRLITYIICNKCSLTIFYCFAARACATCGEWPLEHNAKWKYPSAFYGSSYFHMWWFIFAYNFLL